MFNARLAYDQLLRLSIVSITTVKLVSTAMEIAGVSIPFWWPTCFGITMIYLAMAIKANAAEVTAPGGFPVYAPPPPINPIGRPMM